MINAEEQPIAEPLRQAVAQAITECAYTEECNEARRQKRGDTRYIGCPCQVWVVLVNAHTLEPALLTSILIQRIFEDEALPPNLAIVADTSWDAGTVPRTLEDLVWDCSALDTGVASMRGIDATLDVDLANTQRANATMGGAGGH